MIKKITKRKVSINILLTIQGIKNILISCLVKVRDNMKRIPSKLHRIGTIDACKKFLWYFDDKHCVPDDGVNSLPYFHGDILNQ